MKLIVGLGNPGTRYHDTRHNIGFAVVDSLVREQNASFSRKFQGQVAQVVLENQRLTVLKPETFMNLSGHSVRAAVAFFKLVPSDVLVVHDELDLALGELRLKVGGGHAGHNGLRSIAEQLGSDQTLRLRVGIGRPTGDWHGTMADYVLERFPSLDQPLVAETIERAAEVVRRVVRDGISRAMNQVNQKPKSIAPCSGDNQGRSPKGDE